MVYHGSDIIHNLAQFSTSMAKQKQKNSRFLHTKLQENLQSMVLCGTLFGLFGHLDVNQWEDYPTMCCFLKEILVDQK